MKKWPLLLLSSLLFAFPALAQKKADPPPTKTTTIADVQKSAKELGKSIDELKKTVDEIVPPPVDKDTQIEILKIQREEANLQAQFTHDQTEMQQLQQQFQQDAQKLIGLKLQAEAAQKGKYELDLQSLTYKPAAKPAPAPEKKP